VLPWRSAQQQPAQRPDCEQAQGDGDLATETRAVDQNQAFHPVRYVDGQLHGDRAAQGVADHVCELGDSDGVEEVLDETCDSGK
jgi:hypothetical protein